jgi:hypothetical protein
MARPGRILKRAIPSKRPNTAEAPLSPAASRSRHEGHAASKQPYLVDRVQVTLFPMTAGQTGQEPNFDGAADFDLELIESQAPDGNTQEHITGG